MWGQIFNILLGIWLMVAPHFFHYNGIAADNDQILGPVVSSFAIIALSGCTRAVGKYNIPIGAWLLLAPWVLGYKEEMTVMNDVVTGLLILIFAFFKRKTDQQYGGGWTVVWRRNEPNLELERKENRL